MFEELCKEICKYNPHVTLWNGGKRWNCSSRFTCCALVVDSGNWSWLQQTVLLKSVCVCVWVSPLYEAWPPAGFGSHGLSRRNWMQRVGVICPLSLWGRYSCSDRFPTTANGATVPGEFSTGSLSPCFCVNNLFTSVSDRAVICNVALECEASSG